MNILFIRCSTCHSEHAEQLVINHKPSIQTRMIFQIEQVLLIKDKVYLLTKSLDSNVTFKLSDNSFLGDFEIEKWFDIPKATDENGNYRTDNFAFVLKKETDREKIKQHDILKLSNLYALVAESSYTVSGKIISILECGAGMLDINTVLGYKEKKWKIIQNDMPIGRPKDSALQKKVKDNFWYLYDLEPIGHFERPKVGSSLQVLRNNDIINTF